MTAVTVTSVETLPELDPYRRDTHGESTTTLYIDPGTRTAWVQQDYPGQNGVPEHIWRHRTLSYGIDTRPDQDALSEYLNGEEAQALLAAICDEHTVEWDGSNMVGRLSEAGNAAVEELLAGIEAEVADSDWALWDIDEWFNGAPDDLTAETTDEELAQLTEKYDYMARSDSVMLDGDVREYLTKKRAEMRAELED